MASSPFGFGPLPPIRRSVIDPATGNVTLGTQTPPSALDIGGAYLDLLAGRAKDAITAPQRALSGELQVWDPATGHTTDAATEAAGGMAGLAMTGSLPMSRPAGSLGTFAGRLSKTADHSALAKAEGMIANGADRQAIWDETGWFKGADGQMRYEIPDNASQIGAATEKRLASDGKSDGLAAGTLWHSPLYEAHPDLRNIQVSTQATPIENGQAVVGGSYTHSGVGSITAKAPNAETLRSVLLHEMQHGVQDREGFAAGGMPASLAERLPDPQAVSDARVMSAIARRGTPDDEVASKFMAMLGRDPHPVGRHLFRASTPEELASMPSDGKDAYHRLAGEVEARNVETRRDFTPEQRRAQPPWMTQDVLDENQILNLGRSPSSAFSLGPIPRKGF